MGNGGQAARLMLALVLWLAPGLAVAEACQPDVVHLRGPWGEARFAVEVADDEAGRAQGLMHRRSMPRGAGMLFVYDRPHRATFWMKNTLIPLDILFADASGTVRRIARMTEPMSERLIPGGEGIRYVLEINGGMADTLGIGEGSEMRHPAIVPGAAWPC